jgi:biotin carboxylase
MNFVFLSPHFPAHYYLFCTHLKNLGVNVLGIGDAPYHTLTPALQAALTDYYYLPEMEKYDQVLRACGYFTHRYGKIERIESHNEHWLEIEAQLRTDFNVFGVQSDAIQDVKCKSRMKGKFRQAQLNVARGVIAGSREQILAFVREVGYPLVAKPDNGVGGAGACRLDNDSDLESFLQQQRSVPYFLEEFVSGKICSFDGLVNREGEIVFYTVHQNCDNLMEILHDDLHTAYYSLRQIPDDMREAGWRAVQSFGLRERFFHMEFFRTDNAQKLVALEMNMRPPGGLTMHMFNYANDIDLYQQWANMVATGQFTADYARPYHCAYISRKRNKPYLHSHEEILARYQPWIVHHTEMAPLFWPVMGHYAYLARASGLEQILAIKQFIHQLA